MDISKIVHGNNFILDKEALLDMLINYFSGTVTHRKFGSLYFLPGKLSRVLKNPARNTSSLTK